MDYSSEFGLLRQPPYIIPYHIYLHINRSACTPMSLIDGSVTRLTKMEQGVELDRTKMSKIKRKEEECIERTVGIGITQFSD